MQTTDKGVHYLTKSVEIINNLFIIILIKTEISNFSFYPDEETGNKKDSSYFALMITYQFNSKFSHHLQKLLSFHPDLF